MGDLRMYDSAAANYYNSATVSKVMPLLSWNFHIENYNTMISFKEDLMRLKELGKKWSLEADFLRELTVDKMVIVITTPELSIVYATHNIFQMNGYAQDEVVGASPKMFQGKNTCPVVSNKIRQAVRQELPFDEVVLNYRKDESTYKCSIKGMPLYDKKGVLVNYIAFEKIAA